MSVASSGESLLAVESVTGVEDTVREAMRVDELKGEAHVLGQPRLPAANHEGPGEQPQLVDEASSNGLSGEVGPTDRHVLFHVRLHAPHGVGFEFLLHAGFRARGLGETPGEDDFVGVPPDLGEVSNVGRLVVKGVGLKIQHGFVHPAPVEIGADPSLKVVDKGVVLLIGRPPVNTGLGVLDVAVQ